MVDANAIIAVRATDWPYLLWQLRSELARMLREAAQDEDRHTADRLHQIATSFESGTSE